MTEYEVKIRIKAEKPDQVKELGGLIQFAVNNVVRNDLVKLLNAAKNNPAIVKRALMFL
jgi:hypothetical protein